MSISSFSSLSLSLVLLSGPSASSAKSADSAPALDRHALVCKAVQDHPSVQVARSRHRAALAEADRPTVWEPTRLSWTVAPISVVSSQVAFGQAIRAEQGFVLGKRSKQEALAAAQAEVLSHEEGHVAHLLEHHISVLFVRDYRLARALETQREQRALLEELYQVAVARYSTGAGPQGDPIRIQLELRELSDRELALEGERAVVRVGLNGLLSREPGAPLGAAPQRLAVGPSDAPPGADAVARPELARAQAQERAAARELELSKTLAYPGLSAIGSYNSMWHDRAHQLMVGVGLSLPLQIRSQRARQDAAQQRLRAAQAEQELVLDRIAVERAQAEVRIRELQTRVRLLREETLPLAREQKEVARVAYATGDGALAELIDAERRLRDLELREHELLGDLEMQRAELDYALGQRVTCTSQGTGESN